MRAPQGLAYGCRAVASTPSQAAILPRLAILAMVARLQPVAAWIKRSRMCLMRSCWRCRHCCLSEEDHGQEQSGYRGRHAESEQRVVLQPAHKAHFGTLPRISTDQAATMPNVGRASVERGPSTGSKLAHLSAPRSFAFPLAALHAPASPSKGLRKPGARRDVRVLPPCFNPPRCDRLRIFTFSARMVGM